jgi:integrase
MLSDARIRSAKPRPPDAYKLTDSHGLYLEIRPTGSKLWRYRYRIAKKENVFAIGAYPEVSLADARLERDRARALVKANVHPSGQRRLDRILEANDHATTFQAVALEWLAAKDWTPAVVAYSKKVFERDVFPTIGALPIKRVVPAHVLDILKTTGKRSPGIAAKARRMMSGVFEHAIATLRAENDPVHPVRKAVKQPKSVNKQPLTREQVAEFLELVDVYAGQFETRTAFNLLWLTLARPTEVVEARWAEFDLDGARWRIPAERMKMDAAHNVPLPKQAVALLRRLHAVTGHREILFPHRDNRSQPMSDAALRQAVRNMKLKFSYSPHATRTTGSTLLNEMGFRGDVIERQLAHQERNAVRRTYNHADYFAERAEMMQRWADMLDEIVLKRRTNGALG